MSYSLSRRRIAVVAALTAALVVPVIAEEITADRARQMRQDAAAADAALARVIEDAKDPKSVADARAAKEAVGRIATQLDSFLQAQGTSTDPYAGGRKYPAAANVEIRNFNVAPGATVVHVPVTLDRPIINTVIAHIRVFDGKGGRADPDTRKAVIFRPGDPLTKTVAFAVKNMSAGNDVQAVQQEVPDGGNRKGGGIRITATEGAKNEPVVGGREPLKFEPKGTLTYSGTAQMIQFDDEGGPGRFSTALVHGRTQVGNGETGYYGTVDLKGFERTADGLVLHTRRLDKPVSVGSPATEYPFLATMLSGHKTPETHFKYGSVEWVAKMPNRRFSWPALWLLPTGGWPPEIDVYEGFGYNGSWDFAASLSTNLHGGDANQRTFTRPAMRMTMQTFGLPATLDSAFHTFSVTVTPEWITMWVDGVETMQYANPFVGETWYPLTNVAVKAPIESAYNDGNGAMTVRSIKVWRAE